MLSVNRPAERAARRLTWAATTVRGRMIKRTPFDEPFLRVACYQLTLPIEPSDLAALNAARGQRQVFVIEREHVHRDPAHDQRQKQEEMCWPHSQKFVSNIHGC